MSFSLLGSWAAWASSAPAPAAGAELPRGDLGTLVRDAEDPDWRVRWRAVNELGRSSDRRAVPALVRRALRDDNAHPRWRSLWALKAVDRTGADAVPLLHGGLGDADARVARNAAVGLAFFGREEARAELLRGLDDHDPFRRWEAVYSLGSVGGPEVARQVAARLEHRAEPEARVRGQAALTLRRVGGREAVGPLLEALETDPSPGVRWRAAMTLSRVAGASLAAELERILAVERDPRVREHVQVALGRARGLRPKPTKEEFDAQDH